MAPISCLSTTLDGSASLDIEVQPSSKIQGITGLNRWRQRLSVAVRAAAKQGQANQAVLHVLATTFDIPVHHLSITAGHRSRLKSVRIEGGDVSAIAQRIQDLLEATD